MSPFFLLQNVPFGNISLHLHTFSSILPVRETFSFMSYIGFTLGLHEILIKYTPHPFTLLCIPGGVFKSHILTVQINKLDEMVGLLTVYWG